MSEALLNHLWQSTLFACAAAALTLVFRSNGASVRFKIWLAASLKFLIPFPLLVLMGEHLRWSALGASGATPQWSVFLSQIMQPAASMKLGFGPMVSGTTVSAATVSGATASGVAVSGPTVSDTIWLHWGVAPGRCWSGRSGARCW